jgi:hypothetical protein
MLGLACPKKQTVPRSNFCKQLVHFGEDLVIPFAESVVFAEHFDDAACPRKTCPSIQLQSKLIFRDTNAFQCLGGVALGNEILLVDSRC